MAAPVEEFDPSTSSFPLPSSKPRIGSVWPQLANVTCWVADRTAWIIVYLTLILSFAVAIVLVIVATFPYLVVSLFQWCYGNRMLP